MVYGINNSLADENGIRYVDSARRSSIHHDELSLRLKVSASGQRVPKSQGIS